MGKADDVILIILNLTKYKYDNKGNKIKHTYYSTNEKLREKYIFEYDDKGNMIEKSNYKADGELAYKYTYQYDNKGNEIGYFEYDADEKLTGKYTAKYDDKQNKIEENVYEIKDGKEIPKTQTVYEYSFYELPEASQSEEQKDTGKK